MRLDTFLYENGFAPSRTKAKELIESGRVSVNGIQVAKCAVAVDADAAVTVAPPTHEEYVGRGALKLEAALDTFGIDVRGRVCADIGASTGGFTDCLLRRGAAHVFAVDCGSGQLAPKLRADARVTSLENTNARYIDESTLGERVSLVVMDVSFISQKLLYPAVRAIVLPQADIVTLIKPQFEAGRAALGKNGIVKSEKIRQAVTKDIMQNAALFGFEKRGVIESPIKGGSGNTEYLIHFAVR